MNYLGASPEDVTAAAKAADRLIANSDYFLGKKSAFDAADPKIIEECARYNADCQMVVMFANNMLKQISTMPPATHPAEGRMVSHPEITPAVHPAESRPAPGMEMPLDMSAPAVPAQPRNIAGPVIAGIAALYFLFS